MLPYFHTCVAIALTDVFNSCYVSRDGSIITVTNILSKDLLRSFFASGANTVFGTMDLKTRIGAIWFLPAMFFSTILFQILLKYTADDDRYLGVYTSIIAFIGYLSARFIWLPFSIQSGMMACFFIWVGHHIKKRKLLNDLKWYHYMIAQLILLFGIYSGYCNIAFVVADIVDIIISIPIGLSGCLLIYLISKTDLMGNVLGYIGRNSLVVLCTHLYALETMGVYFNWILDKIGLSGNNRVWMLILLEIAFAVCAAFCVQMIKGWIDQIRKSFREKGSNIHNGRDVAIDIAKGIFITLMLIGHFEIDSAFRSIIYSCHMVAFVFFSGYFYKKDRSVKKSIQNMMYTLLFPYLLLMMCKMLMDHTQIKELSIRYFLGMSFSDKIFSGVPSVGPVYFILLLFVVRIIYLFVDHGIDNGSSKWLVVVCISILGKLIGKSGFWLPWSIDIACYSVIFYQIGIYCRRSDVLTKVKENHISYFILAPIWVYMIHMGSMEIAVRNYGQYGLVILGSVSGILLIYKLSVYIADRSIIIKGFLRLTGEGSMVILIIHTLFGEKIQSWMAYKFDSKNLYYMICAVSLQIVLSWMINGILYRIRFMKR